MCLRDPEADRKPETAPSGAALGREERVEDAREDVLRDARSGVGHGRHDPVTVTLHGELDLTGGAADGMGGIRQEVEKYLLELISASIDDGVLVRVALREARSTSLRSCA